MLGIDAGTWGVAANVATVLGFAAAALAALGTLWQVSSARAVQREVSAKQVYAGVLRLAFDHPEYAEPSGDIHKDAQHAKRYAWFVSNILNSLEEILLTVRGPQWRALIRLLLSYHATYLRSGEFRGPELSTYSPQLRRLIDEACAAETGP